jgi:hypothetical protein
VAVVAALKVVRLEPEAQAVAATAQTTTLLVEMEQ